MPSNTPLTPEEWKAQIESIEDPVTLNMICQAAENNPAYDSEAGTGEDDSGEEDMMVDDTPATKAYPKNEVIKGAKERGIPPSPFPVASDDPDM